MDGTVKHSYNYNDWPQANMMVFQMINDGTSNLDILINQNFAF